MTDRQLIHTAAQVCTPNELKTWTLHQRGLSQRTIALALGISRSTVRSRLENAQRKIQAAERKDAA